MPSELIKKIVELCEIDATIARILAEKKKLETQAAKQKAEYLATAKVAADAKVEFETKQNNFKKEENSLKTERDKIAERRKELASLNNYKVQQAAEKELDHSVRQIQLKEEALLATVDELDLYETKAKEAQKKSSQLRVTVESFLNEAKELMPSLNDRLQRQTASRQEVLKYVNPAYLQQYEKVRSKYPIDAVVSINAQSGCSGCNISVAPNVVQKLMRQDTIERCPGCTRILYVSSEVELQLQTA